MSRTGRRLLFWCVALALASACRDPGVRPVDADFSVSPERALFPLTWVGHPTTRTFRIRSTGPTDLVFTLEVPPPWRLDRTSMTLPAGGEVDVTVTFAPEIADVYQGALTVRSGASERTVPMDALARQPPVCEPSDPCEVAAFDPSSAACVRTTAADGTPCTRPCVTDATCQQGLCTGTPSTCNDQNACTKDACDEATGCVHEPVTCEPPESPCLVALCDPVEGCTARPALDGTPCGPADCVTSHVCLSGVCDVRPTPEGGRCQVSPCAPEGTCTLGTCVQPPPSPLTERWSHAPLAGQTLYFPGVLDDRGNHYWLECGTGACDLVSVTAEGVGRGRWTLEHANGVGTEAGGRMIHAQGLILISHAWDRIEARRADDGEAAWTREVLLDLLEELPRDRLRRVAPSRMVFDGVDQIVVQVAPVAAPQMEGEGCWLMALEVATGALRWKRHYPLNCVDAMVSAGEGVTVFGTYRVSREEASDFSLRAVDRGGEEMWVQSPSIAMPIAANGSTLLQLDTSLVDPTDGTSVGAVFPSALLPIAPPDVVTPLLSGNLGYLFRLPDELAGYTLDGFSVPDGALKWTTGLPMRAPYFAQPILTGTGEVLVAGAMPSSPVPSRLRSISPSGETRFDCPIPGPQPVQGTAVLHQGLWVVPLGPPHARRIAAFEVPGLAPAHSGWVTHGGSMSRAGRALP